MRLHYVQVDIFEEGTQYPVVRHVFYGKTIGEARGYHRAHRGTDAFLRGCEDKNRWSDVVCHAETSEGVVEV